MRTIGWCEACRRVRYVRVLRWRPEGLAFGICADCERAKREGAPRPQRV